MKKEAKKYKNIKEFINIFNNDKDYKYLDGYMKQIYNNFMHPIKGGFKYKGKTIREAKGEAIKKFGNTKRAIKEYKKLDILFCKYKIKKLTKLYNKINN